LSNFSAMSYMSYLSYMFDIFFFIFSDLSPTMRHSISSMLEPALNISRGFSVSGMDIRFQFVQIMSL
jgi:hypothetical protein